MARNFNRDFKEEKGTNKEKCFNLKVKLLIIYFIVFLFYRKSIEINLRLVILLRNVKNIRNSNYRMTNLK